MPPLADFRINGTRTNAGVVLLGNQGAHGDLLTVGSPVGESGTIVVHTVLGDDTSPSDRIVIDGGTATGSTRFEFLTDGPGSRGRHDAARSHRPAS